MVAARARPGPWERCCGDVYGEGRWPEIARTEPEEERLVSAVAEGAGVSFIMLERSRTLRIPGAVFRRFTTPEPTVGIALAWRRGAVLPVDGPPARGRRERRRAVPTYLTSTHADN